MSDFQINSAIFSLTLLLCGSSCNISFEITTTKKTVALKWLQTFFLREKKKTDTVEFKMGKCE